ncbi:MAG: hypothetical protein ABII79_11840 [bacterium]
MPQKENRKVEPKRYRVSGLTCVLAAFVLSRVVYFALGIRFDLRPLDYFWQYVDPELLRTNLLQSLYYLHSQPPLFNLFLGTVLKLFPGSETLAFHITFLACGLVLAVSLYLLMARLGVSERLSAILTILLIAGPSAILYENFLFYTYPVAAMLCLSALALLHYVRTERFRSLVFFFVLLAALVLTRSAFHLVWYVIMVLALTWCLRKQWRRVLLAASVPFLFCLLLYAKNVHEFGSFSSSSWFGMNFARMTTWELTVAERMRLIERRELSPLSLAKPFRDLETYQRHSQFPLAEPTGIPVLDQKQKSSGAPNLNNLTYVRLSREYRRDAMYVLTNYPGTYLMSLLKSLATYFIPISSYPFVSDNREQISYLDRACNLVLCGQLRYEDEVTDIRSWQNTGWLTALAYLVVIIYGFLLLRQAYRQRRLDTPSAVVLLFIWLNVVYITVAGNAFELGENNRFRLVVEPLFFTLLGLALKNRFRRPT